jgi:hypothetical protein
MLSSIRLLLPALLFLSILDAAAQKPGEWPHSRGNEAMTGVSPVELKFPLEPAWQF